MHSLREKYARGIALHSHVGQAVRAVGSVRSGAVSECRAQHELLSPAEGCDRRARPRGMLGGAGGEMRGVRGVQGG